MAATVVQATEQLIVQSATAVMTSVATSSAGEFKNIEHNVASEVISATDEDVPSLLDKVQDGLQDVAEEVVKGAQAAVVAVEQHPELIAEGALAVAIGAASLVQPELVAGEVALIGKMAADSAKKTVAKFATDTSSKVVKAISQDLADDAKEEKAKDVAAAAAKKVAEGGEKTEAASKDSAEPAKDASTGSAPVTSEAKASPATDATGKVPVAPTAEPSKETVKDTSLATPDAKSTPPSDDISKDSKIPSPEPVKEAANGRAAETKVEAEKPAITKDRTIAIEVSQEPSKVASSGEPSASDSKPEAPPVSLKITLGADGEVKAVTKGGIEEKVKTVDPVPVVETKTVSVEKTTMKAVVSAEASQIEGAQKALELVTQPSIIFEKKPAEVQEVPKAINAEVPVEATSAPSKTPTPQPPTISEKKPEESQDVSKVVVATPKVIESPKIIEETAKPVDTALRTSDDASKAIETPTFVDDASKTADLPLKVPSGPLAVVKETPALWSPAVISAVANVSTVTSTTKTKSVSQPAAQDGMATISQESLDLLHSKIDTMHDAIQQITAVLAYHLPTPGTASAAIKSSEEEINEALASAVKPLSELLPEILNNTETAQPLLEGPSTVQPKRPTLEKRTSVLAVFGKVFRPFGGDKVATVKVTEADTEHSERPEVAT